MAERFEKLDEKHKAFIKEQHLYFVGTAAAEGYVKVGCPTPLASWQKGLVQSRVTTGAGPKIRSPASSTPARNEFSIGKSLFPFILHRFVAHTETHPLRATNQVRQSKPATPIRPILNHAGTTTRAGVEPDQVN